MASQTDGLLYSLVLELSPREAGVLPAAHGYQAFGLVLRLLERADPELSRRLHDLPGPKPLTVSPLHGRAAANGEDLALRQGEPCWLRLTVLREDIFARLLAALLSLGPASDLCLGPATFSLRRVITAPGQSPWAGCTSYRALLDGGQAPARRLALRFLSPTVFRAGGQRNLPLPLPGLVFGSLLARWNEFSPLPLPEGLRGAAEEGLFVARYSLQTRLLDFGRYKEVGFVGRCEYEVAPGLGEEAARQLAALAGFAFYAGIGAKTTMGMGQAGPGLPRPAASTMASQRSESSRGD